MNFESTQRECCAHYSAGFFPVLEQQMVVISDGIYEGNGPVEGVRYPSPEHMSGWWLTTNLYNGDTKTLKTVHFRHIFELRPDLAIYMALPFGYRFQLGGDNEHVWFDEDVESESV